MGSLDTNKAVVNRFYEEAWNNKNLAILAETHAPDWVHHDTSNAADLGGGPEGNKARLVQVMSAFPDIHFTLEEVIAEGDRVVVRFTARGTQQGMFAGVPATGKQVAMQGMVIHRVAKGKIAEDWVIRDTLGLLQQLRAIPKPG